MITEDTPYKGDIPVKHGMSLTTVKVGDRLLFIKREARKWEKETYDIVQDRPYNGEVYHVTYYVAL